MTQAVSPEVSACLFCHSREAARTGREGLFGKEPYMMFRGAVEKRSPDDP